MSCSHAAFCFKIKKVACSFFILSVLSCNLPCKRRFRGWIALSSLKSISPLCGAGGVACESAVLPHFDKSEAEERVKKGEGEKKGKKAKQKRARLDSFSYLER